MTHLNCSSILELENHTTMNSVKNDNNVAIENVCLAALYGIIFIIGSFGNVLVIFYFGQKKRKSSLFNYYIHNLGVADFIASTITPIHFVYSIISNKWIFGRIMCCVISSIGPLSVNVSAWIVVSIALERYRGITKPFKKRSNKCRIQCLIIAIWLVSVLSLAPYIKSIEIVDNQCIPLWKNKTHEFIYSIFILLIQSIFPTFAMFSIFVVIQKTVSGRFDIAMTQYENKSAKVSQQLQVNEKIKMQQQRKVFKMLSSALLVFILCSLPYNIFYSTSLYLINVKKVEIDSNFEEMLVQLNIWLSLIVVTNSTMNFFIYAWMDKQFSQFCKQLVRDRKKISRSKDFPSFLSYSSERSKRLNTIINTIQDYDEIEDDNKDDDNL